MEGNEGYGALLYDNARYRAGERRKHAELIQFRKRKRNLVRASFKYN
ncbi:MAG: hypothetical protein JSV09_07190 [Thermoplasmata archaeon]|nr:MAG: hypothetical protein JSV09_07190 [Thermoplasmata archaeon]